MTTNVQLKYKRAIEWCEANRAKLPPRAKFRLMSNTHLYALLDSFGCVWNVKCQLWTDADSENGAEIAESSATQPRDGMPSGRTLIRIIAHFTLIGKRVAELIELCEALNWSVLKVSNPVGEDGDEFVRVYLTIMVGKGGE